MAAATEYERIADLTHKMASDMARADKSSEGMSLNFSTIFKAAVGFDLIKNAVQKIIEQSTIYQSLQGATARTNLSSYNLTQRELRLTNEQAKLEVSRLHGSAIKRNLANQRLEFVNKELEAVKKQVIFAKELQDIGRVRLGLMGMMVTAATTMWYNSRQFNQSLIEANSSWEHRNKLILDTLVAQTQLGISFDDLTKSAAALVHYGMDTSDTFETNLHLVAQMEQGLGVSVGESARLASIVERQLKGSFEGVAHTIAQIVDDTALAGDEAARLATNIATALGRLRPGMVGAMPEVIRLVGRYESALKEVGGQSGAFQQLLTQLTTPEGIVGAGALGVNPEFLATSQGVQQVMDRFAKYGEMLVGQSQGWERQMRLQALAQIFNVTADQANQMLIAVQRANATQMEQISVQERWKQQLNATNSGIQRLGNSLMGLLQGAMYPVVFLVGALANRLADAVQWFTQTKEAVYILGTGVLIATAALTISMVNLARALWQTVMASAAAQAVMARHAALTGASTASSALGGIGGALRSILPTGAFFTAIGTQLTWMRMHLMAGGGMATVTTGLRTALMNLTATGAGILKPVIWIARGVAFMATAAGVLITAFLAAGAVLWKIWGINKQSREDNLAAQKIILSKQEALESSRRAKLYAAARYGEAGDVEAMYKRLATQAGGLFQEIQDPAARKAEQQKWLDEQLASAQSDIAKAMTTRTMFTPLLERTPEELKRGEDMKKVSEKMLKVNEDQKVILEQRRKDAIESRQEEAIERAKNRAWYHRGIFTPLGVASDYYSEIGSD